MVLNLEQKILNIITNEPYLNEDKTDSTLKNICVNALLTNVESENVTGQEKASRYELAIQIIKNQKTDFTVEEVTKLKELIGKIYNTQITGQTYQMLEGK